MRTYIFVISAIITSFCFIGCGSSSLGVKSDWDTVIAQYPDSAYFKAISEATSRDQQMAIDKAAMQARSSIAKMVGKTERTEHFVLTSATLYGSMIVRQEIVQNQESGMYRAKVLVVMHK